MNAAQAERKCVIHMGGEFPRSQRLLLSHVKLANQMPHRFLISQIIRANGTELQLLTQGNVVAIDRVSSSEVAMPIPEETL
jgi:hypothetical protein